MNNVTYDKSFIEQSKRENHNLFQRYLEQARTALLNAMRVHEEADHKGEPCINERVNSIAWFCHSLLLRKENVAQIGEILADYDERHHEHNHSNSEAIHNET